MLQYKLTYKVHFAKRAMLVYIKLPFDAME